MSVLARVRAVNRRAAPEASVALRVAVLVAVLTSALAVLGQGVGGPVERLAMLVGLPVGYVFSYSTRRRDGFWLKVVLAIGLLVAFAEFLRAATSLHGASVADVQVPLAELFLWVQLLHSFDVPTRRDLMFSLTSSIALVAVAAVLAISLSVAPCLVTWALAAITALVLAHRSRLEEFPRLAPDHESAPAAAWAVLRPVALTTTLVMLLGTAAFLVAPEAGTARSLVFPTGLPHATSVPSPGGLANPALGPSGPGSTGSSTGHRSSHESFGYFGFSRTLDTGIRGRPDHTLVMRVRASSPDFWRGQTFDRFDGRSWSSSDDRPRKVRGDAPVTLPLAPDEGTPTSWDRVGDDLVQTYYVEQPGPNLVFGANAPDQLYFPERTVFQLPDGSVRAGVQLGKGAVYTVVSRRPDATPASLRASDARPGAIPERIRALDARPPEVSTRVGTLAATITASAPTTYDKVRALESWMARNTRYTLDVPRLPAGANTVDQFLFVDRRGFCEQIATSLVEMLRSIGVPARLAVGYLPGERDPFTGLYDVHASDAHAWAEVYFPGLGWQGFDPTASVPLAGDSHATAAGSGLFAFLSLHVPAAPIWWPEALAVAVLAASAALALVRVCRRRGRRRAESERSWGDRALTRLEQAGSASGRPRSPAETVSEYARALSAHAPAVALGEVVRTIDVDLYGRERTSAAAQAAADEVIDGLEGAARAVPT